MPSRAPSSAARNGGSTRPSPASAAPSTRCPSSPTRVPWSRVRRRRGSRSCRRRATTRRSSRKSSTPATPRATPRSRWKPPTAGAERTRSARCGRETRPPRPVASSSPTTRGGTRASSLPLRLLFATSPSRTASTSPSRTRSSGSGGRTSTTSRRIRRSSSRRRAASSAPSRMRCPIPGTSSSGPGSSFPAETGRSSPSTAR